MRLFELCTHVQVARNEIVASFKSQIRGWGPEAKKVLENGHPWEE